MRIYGVNVSDNFPMPQRTTARKGTAKGVLSIYRNTNVNNHSAILLREVQFVIPNFCMFIMLFLRI